MIVTLLVAICMVALAYIAWCILGRSNYPADDEKYSSGEDGYLSGVSSVVTTDPLIQPVFPTKRCYRGCGNSCEMYGNIGENYMPSALSIGYANARAQDCLRECINECEGMSQCESGCTSRCMG